MNRPASLFAILLALSAMPQCTALADPPATTTAAPPTPEQKNLLVQMQDAFTKIAANVSPTVVNIKTERLQPGSSFLFGLGPTSPKAAKPGTAPAPPRRAEATGSGVIVRADGYILTNDHVVEGATDGLVTVTMSDGREFQGHVYPDFSSDLAVVKIDPGTTPLPVATFADSALVRPGQWAVAIGSPFDLQNTVTVGIISATGRHQFIPGDNGDGRYYPELFQTDAAINPGNSGGPLFNIDGQVVGINVAIESPVDSSAGIGFAIPSATAQLIMSQLIQSHKVVRGYLGIAPDDLTPALTEVYGQKQGAFVRDVVLSSPAGKAGLQASDIVTSYNGQPVTGEVTFRHLISQTPPGTVVPIVFVRNRKSMNASVTVAQAPATQTDDAPPATLAPTKLMIGLHVRDLTARDREALTAPAETTGVFVTSVDAGSLADSAPLPLVDTVIQKVGTTTINTAADFKQATAGLTSGSSLDLVVLYVANGSLHQAAVSVPL